MAIRFQWPLYREDEGYDCPHRFLRLRWPVRRVRKALPLASVEIVRAASLTLSHGPIFNRDALLFISPGLGDFDMDDANCVSCWGLHDAEVPKE